MTSADWGILIGAAVAVATPNVLAWAATYAKLGVLTERLAQRDRDLSRLQKNVVAVCRRTQGHSRRLHVIDEVLGKMSAECNVPFTGSGGADAP